MFGCSLGEIVGVRACVGVFYSKGWFYSMFGPFLGENVGFYSMFGRFLGANVGLHHVWMFLGVNMLVLQYV